MFKGRCGPWISAALLCSAVPGWGQGLPEGKGKDIVANACIGCHTLSARLGGGYSAEGWSTVMRMMTNHGLALAAEDLASATEYLIKNFPEKPKPAGVLLAGPAGVSIKVWPLSTPARDPMIRWRLRMARCGTRVRWPTCSAGSIRGPAHSSSSRSRRRTRARTVSSRTRPATSGRRETPVR